jgi:GNAT superfamily N-acetyltransferase
LPTPHLSGRLPVMGWTVRRATREDAEAVRDVASAGWRDTYSGVLRATTIEAFLAGPYGIENVRRRITEHDFFVAEGEDGIAAFADAVPDGARIFLAAMYALPVRRGQGAGTALLEAIAGLHPALPIDAHVLLGNRKGESFYERRGFVPEESLEGELFGEPVTERPWRRPARGGGASP